MDPAQAILNAYDTKQCIPLLDPALDAAGAYAIAAELNGLRVARGETPAGRKIGFNDPGQWLKLGVTAPMWGYVYDTTVFHAEDGKAQFAVDRLPQPRIETEIQMHFASTPPAGAGARAILDCVDWFAQGFEIAQCPFEGWKFRGVDAIAAGALHAALVVGPRITVAGCDDCVEKLSDFRAELYRDGAFQLTGTGADVLGSPLNAVRLMAQVLDPQKLPLQAGEIVSTGTLTPPTPIAAGETWSTTLDGIDLPGMSITFT